MSKKDLLDNIKKLREMTGVGFKDCKLALDESEGNIEKSIEFLRKKGIAKASKKMSRTASEGLVLVKEENGEVSIIEINSETDFVAKNKDFISFCRELSDINFATKGDLDKLNNSKMFNKLDGVVKGKNDDIGNKISMHIAASNPIAIDKDKIKKEIVEKELEIIKAEIENSGKPKEMAEKISKGKIAKFISDNTLINQIWIMDPKKKVSDILKENKIDKEMKVLDFIRYKVGEGI